MVGWYGLALTEILDDLPADLQGRDRLISSLQDLSAALVRYQDKESGLWYQVMDKGERSDNWLETSCSALFVYTLAKSAEKGYLDKSFQAAARKGYKGLLGKVYFDQRNLFVMPDICIGTSAGDYENYVTRPTSENDLHGVGAFVMACLAIDRIDPGEKR